MGFVPEQSVSVYIGAKGAPAPFRKPVQSPRGLGWLPEKLNLILRCRRRKEEERYQAALKGGDWREIGHYIPNAVVESVDFEMDRGDTISAFQEFRLDLKLLPDPETHAIFTGMSR